MDWNYAFTNFDGRLNRQPFWIATLVLWVASVVASLIASVIFGSGFFGSLIQLVIALAVLVPSLAVAVKRCHDRDKSGWWVLIALIPILGWIWYIVELGFLPGTPGPNRFGPDPLGPATTPGA